MKNPMLFVGLVATLILILPPSSTLKLTSRNSTDNQLLRTISSDLENLDMSDVKPNETEWLAYKAKYGKSYSSEEDSIRRSIFAYKKHRVDKFNAKESKKVGFSMGLNDFSDLSSTEMKMRIGFRSLQADDEPINSPEAQKFLNDILNENTEIPDELDWREVPGRVSRVKRQLCGSCWAFASTGALEGQEMVRGTNVREGFVELSEQNLVDCVYTTRTGCEGGFLDDAFNYIKEVGGIASEHSYPSAATSSECRFSKDQVAFTVAGAAYLPEGDEETLKKVVAIFGPVPVYVNSTNNKFEDYADGIFYEENCGHSMSDLDHAVLVVGYGTDELLGDFWIVKNSWGQNWGDEGYVKMARNRGNSCGIATRPTIPTF